LGLENGLDILEVE